MLLRAERAIMTPRKWELLNVDMVVGAVPAPASAAIATFEVGPGGHDEQTVFHIIVDTFYRPAGAAVLGSGVGALPAFDLLYELRYGVLYRRFQAIGAQAAFPSGGRHRQGRVAKAPATALLVFGPTVKAGATICAF